MIENLQAVIGLEVHCQLSTETKIFCSCRARLTPSLSVSEVAVNLHTCPICAGHPGTLPVLNRKVVQFAIQAGLATHCQVHLWSVFERKHYFYPDSPKGYQISQYIHPLCEKGWIIIDAETDQKKIGIQRIHLEEDAGKNIHREGFSLVNLNRAGVPLIEVVSGPDMHTSQEAGAYLRALHAIVTYLEICDGNMQEGNFRCDANVSVKRKDAEKLGTRVEIKNINSFRFVEKAIDYEIARQTQLIRSGGHVIQETRTYNSEKNTTISMRSKEEAHDYRYFPDPDLQPLVLSADWVEELQKKLPELPENKKERWRKTYPLSSDDMNILIRSKSFAQFFEQVMEYLDPSFAKAVSNCLTGEVTRLLNEGGIEIQHSLLQPKHIADLVQLLQSEVLSSTGAKQVLAHLWKTEGSVQNVMDQKNLKQVSDVSQLEKVIDEILITYPMQVGEYRSGKEKLLGFFVGQAMQVMKGQANPELLGNLFKNKLL